jgi:hypothetical protein
MKKTGLWVKVHGFAALVCAAAWLVLAGCENVALGDGAASGSKGILKLNIADGLSLSKNNGGVSASVGGIVKTANPDNVESYWDKYVLHFEGGSQSDIEVQSNDSEKISGNIITVEVEPGTYTVTITAYKGTVAAAKGTVTASVAQGLTADTEVVYMTPRTKDEDDSLEDGRLAYDIDLTGLSALSKKELYFTNGVDTTKITISGNNTITLTENTKSEGTAALPPGRYKVWVDLIKDDKWAGIFGDIVYIYAAQESKLPAIAFTEANFSPTVPADDPIGGGISDEIKFPGTITVSGWTEGLTIAKDGGTATFSIDSGYTDIEWYLGNVKQSSTGTSFELNPANCDVQTYGLLVIANNAGGVQESSGTLFVTITEGAGGGGGGSGGGEDPLGGEDPESIVEAVVISGIQYYISHAAGGDSKENPVIVKIKKNESLPTDYTYLKTALTSSKYIVLDMSETGWTKVGGKTASPSYQTSGFNYLYSLANLIGVILPNNTMTSIGSMCLKMNNIEWIKFPENCVVENCFNMFDQSTSIKKIILEGGIGNPGEAYVWGSSGNIVKLWNTFKNNEYHLDKGTYVYDANNSAWSKE